MKKESYKTYPRYFIGESDIASLILRSCENIAELIFHSDGAYHAYFVDENAVIGDHYVKVFEGEAWMKIYDDKSLVMEVVADKIIVYRAGDFGCIIQSIHGSQK